MSKTKIRFFTIADYEQEEQWLHEQHLKGLKLVRTIAPCFFVFEECQPEDVIYRLEFKNEPATGTYIQTYSDYGWEYCSTCVGWHYFRKNSAQAAAENEGELFSDKESKLNMITKIIRRRMLPLAVIFFSCVVPNINRILRNGRSVGDVILAAIFSLLFIFYIYIFIHCGTKLRWMKKELEQ